MAFASFLFHNSPLTTFAVSLRPLLCAPCCYRRKWPGADCSGGIWVGKGASVCHAKVEAGGSKRSESAGLSPTVFGLFA